MQTLISVSAGAISIAGPYSDSNNQEWRNLGGKFTEGAWTIPDTEVARATVAELFGAKSDEVDALVPFEKISGYGGIIQCGGYVLAQRRDRDSRVTMPPGVSLERGAFARSGGSRKNPSVGTDPAMIFRLRCRRSFAESKGLELAQAPAAPVIDI